MMPTNMTSKLSMEMAFILTENLLKSMFIIGKSIFTTSLLLLEVGILSLILRMGRL